MHYHFWLGEAKECEHRFPEHCAPGAHRSWAAGAHVQGAEHTSRVRPALQGAATAAAASATPGTTPAALTRKSEKRVTN